MNMKKRHKRLMKKEKYYRRCRRVTLQLLILNILFLFTPPIILSQEQQDKFFDGAFGIFFTGLCLLVFMYWECHLKIQHIETIKFFKEN